MPLKPEGYLGLDIGGTGAKAGVVDAVMLAAVGCGAFASLEESSEAFHKGERIFTVRPENHAVYKALCGDYVRFYRHVYSHRP